MSLCFCDELCAEMGQEWIDVTYTVRDSNLDTRVVEEAGSRVRQEGTQKRNVLVTDVLV
jgi:hypothetical protein